MNAFKLHLRDRNRRFIDAARFAFADMIAAGRVTASTGDIFEGPTADAILSPANSFGYMDGGIDLAYRDRFGLAIEAQLQAEISTHWFGELAVGQAVIVPTGDVPIGWLVAAPTMRVPMDVARTTNAYVGFRAALIAVKKTAGTTNRIDSLLSPGLCIGIGSMDPAIAARQMRAAWDCIVLGHRFHLPAEARGSQLHLEGRASPPTDSHDDRPKKDAQ
jgi:O-acetyl-ADP-ribose deacetylase (regulator of RNase III)